VGLMDEVFKSYYYFEDEISSDQLRNLLLRFSKMHSYRYNIKFSKPFRLVKQYAYLSEKMPDLKGLRSELTLHLFKDYLLSLAKR
jgi:hypothetical protein